MATTIDVATDEILAALKAAWDAGATSVAGVSSTPTIVYDREDTGETRGSPGTPWARAVVRHSDSKQATLGNVSGATRHTNYGLATAQIFAPNLAGEGANMGEGLAKVAQAAWKGKSTANVCFRSVKIVEAGRDGPWYQYNVVATFDWQEIVS